MGTQHTRSVYLTHSILGIGLTTIQMYGTLKTRHATDWTSWTEKATHTTA
jgi:hypothetical protein